MTRYLTENMVETLYGHVGVTSKAERVFWDIWYPRYGKNSTTCLRPQHPVGKYRVDFAHFPSKTAIEIDGSEHYLDPEVIVKDRKRQKDIEAQGWYVIRFGAWKVFKDVESCVDEVRTILTRTGTFIPTKETQYRPDDRVYIPHCGEGVVLKSEIVACAEFVTVQFQNKRLRLNTSVGKLWRSASHYQSTLQYQPGDKVHHPKFGVGVVLGSELQEIGELVDVQFPDKRARLMTPYAKLNPCYK